MWDACSTFHYQRHSPLNPHLVYWLLEKHTSGLARIFQRGVVQIA